MPVNIFKIGIGPSSSHTYAPMKICYDFIRSNLHYTFTNIDITLYGSLAFTGKGHKTDVACMLGLMGNRPDRLDSEAISKLPRSNKLMVNNHYESNFSINYKYEMHDAHPNTLEIAAHTSDGIGVYRTFCSTGGGAYHQHGVSKPENENTLFEFKTMTEFKELIKEKTIEEIVPFHDINDILRVMNDSVIRGITSKETVLPGSIGLKRRAHKLFEQLKAEKKPLLSYLPVYAMAVNEENAGSWEPIVTAPTNGSCGVIPACLQMIDDKHTFLRYANVIGHIIRENASLSGAEAGCMGEVGSASAMAAAGLMAANGGTIQQIENAAEIAMEHSLGMTCDPVDGLVQVPCIERNAMGALKAYNAYELASLSSDPTFVSFDRVIEAMNDTAKGMREEYKETSKGGLARVC